MEISFSSSFLPGIIGLVVLIAEWLILNKAGEKGWKVLIPFYGQYVFCKIAVSKKFAVWYLILSIVVIAAFVCLCSSVLFPVCDVLIKNHEALISQTMSAEALLADLNFDQGWLISSMFVSVIVGFIFAVMYIVSNIKLCGKFDTDTGMKVLMFFLPQIAYCVLAFGNYEYQLNSTD